MSYWKLLTARWGSNAGETDEARIDASTNTLQTIAYEHHEIHDGTHYSVIDAIDLSTNNTRDIQITTPDTTVWAHLTISLDTESETEWWVYENVTINVAGTSVTLINDNRNSTNASGLTIAVIDNTSVANANSDTAIASATMLAHGLSGAGKDAGSDARSREFILKQNEDYSIRFLANAAGYVDYVLEWYEHTNKH